MSSPPDMSSRTDPSSALTAPGRVLVADDSPVIREYMSELVEAQGHTVLLAVNGEEAYRYCREHRPDIALLDVIMPELTGYDVCRKIKENPETRLIPVVLITTLDEPEDKIRGLEAGADDFLTKPVDESELVARIRNLLRLHRIGREMELANRRIRKAEDARKTLTTFLTQDLRSLLQSMDSNLALLVRGGSGPGGAETLMQTRMICMEASRLLGDLEASQKLEDLQFPITLRAVRVADVVEVAAATFGGLTRGRDLTLDRRLESVPDAHVDQHLLERVIASLISTSLSLSPSGGEIVISLRSGDGQVHLEVADPGPDASPPASHPRRNMCLEFCTVAVRAMGGSLVAGSFGDTFRVTLALPAVEAAAEDGDLPAFSTGDDDEDVPALSTGNDPDGD